MRSIFKRAFLTLVTAGCIVSSTAGWAMLCTGQTSLSLNPANQEAWGGRECLFLHYPAEDPTEVRLSRDGEEVMYYRRGVDILQPPRNVCFSTEEIKPGPHEYRLEITCDGEVATATLTVNTRHPDFGLKRAIPSQLIYQAGQELVLDIDAGSEGVAISADFSPIDSAYQAKAETLERLGGGRYRMRYMLSRQNTRRAGVHPVTLQLVKDGKRQVVRNAVELTYLPRGRSEVLASSGQFSPQDLSRRSSSTRFAIVNAELQQSQGGGGARAGTLDPLRPFELVATIRSSLPLQRDEIDLELIDQRHDGYWSIPVELDTGQCQAGECMYTARAALRSDMTVVDLNRGDTGADLALRAVSQGTATAMFFVPGLWLTAKEFDHTHSVHGEIHFEYQKLIADYFESVGLENWPQYAIPTEVAQERPARWVNVVLEDECGHYIKGETDHMGQFSFDWTPVGCEDATITVWSVIEGFSRKAAVGQWKWGPVNSICEDLTGNTEDYLPYSYTQHFTISSAALNEHPNGVTLEITVPDTNVAAKGFYILDNVVRAQDYYDDIQGVSTLPKLNVVYSPGLKPANWAEPADGDCDWEPGDDKDPDGKWDGMWARYVPSKDPGFIFIPAEPSVDYGWSAFAHVHETAHYFHHHYLRNASYGRIGEPLANAQAAAILGTEWMITPWSAESLDVNANYEDRDGDGEDEFWQADITFGESVSAGWIWRILWDLVDGGPSEAEPLTEFIPEDGGSPMDFGQFDDYAGGGGTGGSVDADDHEINDVLVNYLGGGVYGTENPDYQDRGLGNVDLVDLLDGMICRNQITQEEMEGIVDVAMGFGYDYGVAPGSCD